MKHVTAGVVVLLVLALAQAGSSINRPGTIRVTDRVLYERPTTAGTLTVSRIYNRSITPNAIGNAEVICVEIGGGDGAPFPEGSRYCWGSFSIGNNSLVVHGVARSRVYYQLAIAGGTGTYSNVGGTFTSIRYSSAPVRERLIFQLTYP